MPRRLSSPVLAVAAPLLLTLATASGGCGWSVCGSDDQRPCYTGPSASAGVGTCKAGTQVCTEDGSWGACREEIVPSLERCNGLDDDCDGEIDEELLRPPCGRSKGLCHGMTRLCYGARGWLECSIERYRRELPGFVQEEDGRHCDGLDNDCDGEIDEGCRCNEGDTRKCYTGKAGTEGKGTCRAGASTCVSGRWSSTCEGQVVPVAESCNGKDDDCDGQTDEGFGELGKSCTVPGKKGLCSVGKYSSCRGGKPVCAGPAPTTERCDGKDNDCDGGTDESFPEKGRACTVPGKKGVCLSGTYRSCFAGRLVCTGPSPTTELCNGKDDDCDGVVDDKATCPAGQACRSGRCQGTCSNRCSPSGAKRCEPGGKGPQSCIKGSSGCLDWSTPTACPTGKSCHQGACVCVHRCLKEGDQRCDPGGAGVQTCAKDSAGCRTWSKPAGCPSGLVCKAGRCEAGCSDNCPRDGATRCDPGGKGVQTCVRALNGCLDWSTPSACPTSSTCTSGACVPVCVARCSREGDSLCAGGDTIARVCRKGAKGCLEWVTTRCKLGETCRSGVCKTLLCGTTASCYTGPDGTLDVGECRTGSQACSGGAWTCSGDITPGTERCDGKDNDCDGKVDDGASCPGGMTCKGGACVGSCQDKCPQENDTRCDPAGKGVQTCRKGSSGCLDWSAPASCPGGGTCSGGKC